MVPTGRRVHHVARASLILWRLFRSSHPDVVFANGVKAAFAALPASRLAGVQCVWGKHDFVWDRPYGRVAGRWFDSVIATSRELLDSVGVHGGHVLPPPLPDGEPLGRDDARRELDAFGVQLDEAPALAMVCRIVGYKGIDDAIRALTYPTGSAWRLVVLGSEDPGAPGTLESLVQLARSLRVGHRVHFVGEVPNAARLLRAFDAVAVLTKSHPDSRYRAEGFSITALEAFVAGVPVIATASTPALRIIGSGGITVEPHAPHQVAQALEQIASHHADAHPAAALLADYPSADELAIQLWEILAAAGRRAGAHLDLGVGPSVSVVTTVLNENGSGLAAWTRTLARQLRPGDEMVVVDGGSTDGTQTTITGVATELECRGAGGTSAGERAARVDIRVIEAPGVNISAGRNLGIAAAVNDVIAVTDAGCDPEPSWLDALRRGFAGGAADLVTGVYRPGVTGPIDEAFAHVGFPSVDEATHPDPLVRAYGAVLGRTFDARMCTGRSAAFRKLAWKQAGGYPEDLATAEDVTFGMRIATAGGQCVLASDASVLWWQRPTLAAKLRMFAGYGRGDADSGDALLIGRNVARGLAMVAVPVLVARRSPQASAVGVAGLAAYLSLPMRRAWRGRSSPTTIALLAPVAIARESTKAGACAARLVRNRMPAPRG